MVMSHAAEEGTPHTVALCYVRQSIHGPDSRSAAQNNNARTSRRCARSTAGSPCGSWRQKATARASVKRSVRHGNG